MATKVTEKNFASRNRKRQSEFRRQQLIAATIDCIDSLGLSQTTLARIAERARLSQGNVVFHFHSKDELLEQTLQYLNAEYTRNWREAIAKAPSDPMSQLRAMVRSSFSPQVFNRKKISVWYAFWGESRSRPKYMQVCGSSDREFSDKLRFLCQAISAQKGARLGAETAALSIEGMIDGLWQTLLLGSPELKRKQAIAAVDELVDGLFPEPEDNPSRL